MQKPEVVNSSRKYRVRVLVCAPSNSALDEIVLRVLNTGISSFFLHICICLISIIQPSLLWYMLDAVLLNSCTYLCRITLSLASSSSTEKKYNTKEYQELASWIWTSVKYWKFWVQTSSCLVLIWFWLAIMEN